MLGVEWRSAAQPIMPTAEFIPPTQYSVIWPLLAVGIVVLIVAWFVVVPLLTRDRPRVDEPAELQLSVDPRELRARYLALIAEVESEHSTGAIAVRPAHQRLGGILRSFVAEREGLRVGTMTLEDLRSNRVRPLDDAVGMLYPTSFRESGPGTVDEAADIARRLVREWN